MTNNQSITGGQAAISNLTGAIYTLSNTTGASINGGNTGVRNTSNIATLTNSGLIAGVNSYGIYNSDGSIATLTNTAAGTISGKTGIQNNNAGTITTLTNAGLITGGVSGFANSGIINTLTNAGTITGATDAVHNNGGTIATLANTGNITGGLTAIENDSGSITQLTNNSGGSITGRNVGIENYGGSIGTVSNTGLIAGTYFFGIDNNAGTITELINNAGGTISGDVSEFNIFGQSGIANRGGALLATLTNAGLIEGAFGIGNKVSGIGTLNNETGGTISGDITGIYNSGSIATLTNSGMISGHQSGIFNGFSGITTGTGQAPSIATLTNAGTITASVTAIENGGIIATLTNAGLITGGNQGIYNDAGTIRVLTNTSTGGISSVYNTGLIGGTSASTAIFNAGSIATLTNSGVISATREGLFNANGTIATLTNSGTIAGTSGDGLTNMASIGVLGNALGGTVSGVLVGIFNNRGSIGTLTNAGMITSADDYGIENAGTISLLANNLGGTISGPTGINNQGFVGTLSNSGLVNGKTADGISNFGHIATLENIGQGLIKGNIGIINQGLIGTLSNGSTATVSGGDYGIGNGAIINTLTNAGTVTGGVTAISNGGTINTLTNTGLVSGGDYGIASAESIVALTNSGMITGGIYGIGNFEGIIGQLANNATGTISGHSGINNALGATITSLTNAGTINGASVGIYSGGAIGTLTNAGLITGNDLGINNSGTIAMLSNMIGGTITGSGGIENQGSIGTLSNFGLITSNGDSIYNDSGATIITLANTGTITGTDNQIQNAGFIGQLTNEDIINSTGGHYAIDNAGGTIGTLINGLTGTAFIGVMHNGGTIGQITNGKGGTIFGNSKASYNQGVIGTLTNAGLIQGGSDDGIYNPQGTIVQLINLVGGSIIGGETGIRNTPYIYAATIGTLTNSGLITGGEDGIYNFYSTIGELTNNTGGTISGDGTATYNQGFIATLTNAGLITGDGGIGNKGGGTIATLTNSDTISGSFAGVSNEGFIGTLSNTDAITGGVVGINNILGTIGQLTNGAGGTIAGPSGIINEGGSSIAAIANDNLATIIAADSAILNNGILSTLSNNGLISGAAYAGFDNEFGTIAALTNGNTGTIAGGTAGVVNDYFMGTLSNTGLISGGTDGIDNVYGTIGTLTNNAGGTITGGGSAIFSTGGHLGTLTNSGLIDGNLTVQNQDLNIIGGAGSIFGALTGGAIIANDGNFNLLSGNEILTDSVTVGGYTLINSGTLQIGFTGAPATIGITGSFSQTSAGTLNVIVTPARSSELNVSGLVTLSGAVDYIFAPGTYTPKTYSFIAASTGILGTFTTQNYQGVPDASTTYSADPTANLVLGAGFTFPLVVSPSDSSIFSDQTQALAEATQLSDASLLGIAATGGAAVSPACEGQAALNSGSTSNGNNANIASAIAAALCNHGGWIQAGGSLGHVDGSGDGATAYNANTAGFLAGIDRLFGNTRLGVAVGYDETYLADKSGGKGDMGTTLLALYGAQPLGRITLTGVIGYGYAGNTTTRATGIGSVKENNNLNILSGAIQASTAYALSGFEIIPSLGIRYAYLGNTHFTEAAGQNNAFALTGETRAFNNLQPYATAEFTTNYATMSGYSISPQATLGLQDEAGNRGAATALYAADGTYFASTHNTIDPLAAILGAGVSMDKNNLSLYLDYSGVVAGNWNTQQGTAGLRITF